MSNDPITRLALERAVRVSAELEVQLDRDAKLHPVISILAIARKRATEAFHDIVNVDPGDRNAVQGLQNEIRRYDDLVGFIKDLVIAGKEADHLLSEQDKAEFDDIIMTPEVRREVEAVGGIAQEHDA